MKSLLLMAFFSFIGFANTHQSIVADQETDPVGSSRDAADDIAIWYDEGQPDASLIIGTDKQWGLIAYDLKGKKVSEYAAGRVNNVDLRGDVKWGLGTIQIIAGSERSQQAIDFYALDAQKQFKKVSSLKLKYEPYGICLGWDAQKTSLQIYITTKSGFVDHWTASNNGQDLAAGNFINVGKFAFSSVTEGCVQDDRRNQLFVSQENTGLWQIDLANPSQKKLVDQVGKGGRLVADVEGVSIYERPGREPLLLVSSQGENAFHVYNLETLRHRGSFQLVSSSGGYGGIAVDGVNDTDGIETTALNLGIYPEGLFIAQDGSNQSVKGGTENQNFKLVSFEKILKALGL